MLGNEVCKGRDVGNLLAGATPETVKIDSAKYLQLLDEFMFEIVNSIDGLFSLSSVEEGRDSFGQ